MIGFWRNSGTIINRIYIPKYYDPELRSDISSLEEKYYLVSIGDLIRRGVMDVSTGDEIGKMAYGTGNIPFIRTSDISNWEVISSPKQGTSEKVFQTYREKQDVRAGDILLVRDGTYLIGTNCMVTSLDLPLLYQSHVLKFRVSANNGVVEPEVFFLALNSPIVKRQLRSVQFTADTIDTIGDRFRETMVPIPRDGRMRRGMSRSVRKALDDRLRHHAFVRQARLLIGDAIRKGETRQIDDFLRLDVGSLPGELIRDTVAGEFGGFRHFWIKESGIRDRIYIPRYYDPGVRKTLRALAGTCKCVTIGELVEKGTLTVRTGDEVGKMAYGGGDIPFYRTSDFQSWELKHDPKQSVAESVYRELKDRQDLRVNDVLLVRDGTYLVGNVCLVSDSDVPGLYCGGIFRIRTEDVEAISPHLLLALLSSYVVRQQIRAKQFTRDVIDTLGNRLFEVVLPVPRDRRLRVRLGAVVERVVDGRVNARQRLADLANRYANA